MRQGFIAAALAAAGLFAFSQANAAGTPKFGVIDVNTVITKSHRFQQGLGEVQALGNKLQSEFDDKSNKFKTLNDQLTKTDSKSSGYQKLADQVQEAKQDAQQFFNQSQQELQQDRQQLAQQVQGELAKVLGIYAKNKGFDMIFVKGSGTAYATESYDVTTDVLAALDKDWAELEKTQPAPAAATKK